MKKYILMFLAMGLFFTNCSSDDNILPDTGPEQEDPKTVADYPTQDFLWLAMNTYYFWQADVPSLADNKFTGENDPDYITFLASEANPTDFFYRNLCNDHVRAVGETAAVDRFSSIADNYKDLVNSLQGISSSNGVEFDLYAADNDFDIYGIVNYILPDSDASGKDIKRGDIFNGVNGQLLNRDTYIDLLFGDEVSYTLNLADIDNDDVIGNGKEVSLTKVENFPENPIYISKVLEQNGKKIGYLLYNRFVAAFDDDLNDAFGRFKAENIQELILDFRYNPGGRISSAIQIASSVYGAETDEVFLTPRFNNKLQQQAGQPDNFTDKTLDSKIPLNVLGLKRIFVITSPSTASASELVINGLEPYVDVVQVGTKTVGKNEFSNTFVDDPENGYFYSPNRENEINPNNQWAIQPLLGRNENADGFSDYTGGLIPDYELREDIENPGVLGEEDEPLLALTLSVISGATAKRSFQPVFPANYLTNSKMFEPTRDNMFMDGLLKPFNTSE